MSQGNKNIQANLLGLFNRMTGNNFSTVHEANDWLIANGGGQKVAEKFHADFSHETLNEKYQTNYPTSIPMDVLKEIQSSDNLPDELKEIAGIPGVRVVRLSDFIRQTGVDPTKSIDDINSSTVIDETSSRINASKIFGDLNPGTLVDESGKAHGPHCICGFEDEAQEAMAAAYGEDVGKGLVSFYSTPEFLQGLDILLNNDNFSQLFDRFVEAEVRTGMEIVNDPQQVLNLAKLSLAQTFFVGYTAGKLRGVKESVESSSSQR